MRKNISLGFGTILLLLSIPFFIYKWFPLFFLILVGSIGFYYYYFIKVFYEKRKKLEKRNTCQLKFVKENPPEAEYPDSPFPQY